MNPDAASDSPEGRSDGGYAVSDFRKVKPELGSMEDLECLAEDCHGRGISDHGTGKLYVAS